MTKMTPPLLLKGLGMWTPGLASAGAFLCGEVPDPGVTAPPARCLPPTLRRRASLLTRAGIEAMSEAAAVGGADLAVIPTIWASAYGEIDNTVALLDMMRGDGMPSPTRFHNSVHNTASGTASIALGNRSFSTALAAGVETASMGFIEASAWLATRGGEILLVCLDEPPPPPFTPPRPWPLLAVAFHLAADEAIDPDSPIQPRRLALETIVSACARYEDTADATGLPTPLRPFYGHPLLPALAFLHHLHELPDDERPSSAPEAT